MTGSTDQTQEVLKPYMHKIDYFRIKQSGKSKAINSVFDKVSGDYLWIFDDDDLAFPEALKRFVLPLETNPQYGFSFSSFFTFSEKASNGQVLSDENESKIPDINNNGFLISLMEGNFLGGGSIFVRSSCYKKVGLYNSEYLRSQDYDMAIRIAQHFFMALWLKEGQHLIKGNIQAIEGRAQRGSIKVI